jgi:hypothetical protein
MSDGHKEQSINDQIRYWAQQTPDAPALSSADVARLLVRHLQKDG